MLLSTHRIKKVSNMTDLDVDPGGIVVVVEEGEDPDLYVNGFLFKNIQADVPDCSRSNVTSNGDPYTLRTSTENKHQLVPSSMPKLL
jgi:hypothetical protein